MANVVFCAFQRVSKTIKGHGPWKGLIKFLFIVDHDQSFSLTGTPLSKGSEVRELIASHKAISTACVDLLLPCGYLVYRVTVSPSELKDIV